MNQFTPEESHQQSLFTLHELQQHDDLLDSIKSIADVGCGTGLDIKWWAENHNREEDQTPRNIKCYAVDLAPKLNYDIPKNLHVIENDFTKEPFLPVKVDMIWSHNSLGHAINPYETLAVWNRQMNAGGIICVILPQMHNVEYNRVHCHHFPGYFYNFNIINLVYMLACAGFDCKDGLFYKAKNDPWLHAIAYKSKYTPMDPLTTSWHDLSERELLPDSFNESLQRTNTITNQPHLILRWANGSKFDLANTA